MRRNQKLNSKEALEELQCVLVSNQATKRYDSQIVQIALEEILKKYSKKFKKELKDYSKKRS